MPTFLTTMTWRGNPKPDASDVRRAMRHEMRELSHLGVHSVIFLPSAPRGRTVRHAAVVISKSEAGADAVPQLARTLARAPVHVDTIRVDSPRTNARRVSRGGRHRRYHMGGRDTGLPAA